MIPADAGTVLVPLARKAIADELGRANGVRLPSTDPTGCASPAPRSSR